ITALFCCHETHTQRLPRKETTMKREALAILMKLAVVVGSILSASAQAPCDSYPSSAGTLRHPVVITAPTGFSTVTLLLTGPSNKVADVFPNPPEGTLLYRFRQPDQAYTVNQFQFGTWVGPDEWLSSGEAVVIRNPSNDFSITFSA